MSDDSLEGAIRAAIEDSLITLHTSMPAIIHKVNADGSVHVIPVIKKVKVDKSEFELPIVPNAPVQYPSTGAYSITWPLSEGDEGLLVFSERDISRFLSTGNVSAPIEYRKHNLSDAIFIPCSLSHSKRPAPNSSDGLEIKDIAGGASIQLFGGAVNIIGVLNINGVPYTTHTHTGVATGGGISGPVTS